MIRRPLISAYTPSNTDPELLSRIFVQRQRLLQQVVTRLKTSMSSADKHHLLLSGPRGSGKTLMVTLVVWQLEQIPELGETMRIAWLGEDDIFSGLIHFAFGIAKTLADRYPEEFPKDFKSDVRGLPPDDAAMSVLQQVLKNLNQHHLLLVTENLDQTFGGLGETGQKKLRAFLQETRRISILATTQQLFDGVSKRDQSFFGFFDTHHLSPLSVDDAVLLIRKIATEQQNFELLEFLDSSTARYRIRALHHLAGGNHRMYVLLSEFLTKKSLEDLVTAFEALAEEMTPYFQERMRSLPDQQRQLVQTLCDADGAMTVKELSEETFIAEGNCSKQLGHLKSKGYVVSERRGKESYYDMAEPLMRLCLEVKNQRGRPLKLIARFLKAWFPVPRLQTAFSIPEAMVPIRSVDEVVEALRRAFREASCEAQGFGGTPSELLAMILKHGSSQWSGYVEAITPLYIEHDLVDKLGQALTHSIQVLDSGDYSPSQLDAWNTAWQKAGKDCEGLQIPLACLSAAIEVLKSDPPSDRPLFRLPMEIRQLVRPLLKHKLGDE